MMDRSPKLPVALTRAIVQDLRPVKPSPRPLYLALRMVPLALLVSSVILLAIGPRPDSGILGPLLTWGASAAQFLVAIVLIWIAAHEGTPAGRLPRQMVYSAAVVASLVVVFVTLLTFSTSPGNETLGVSVWIANKTLHVSPWIMGFACGIGSTLAGGDTSPVFQLGVSLKLACDSSNRVGRAVWRAGAGLAINAGWRIACPISTPVACAGSARSSDHRDSDLRINHRTFFRKSQIERECQRIRKHHPSQVVSLRALLPVQEMFRRVDFLGNKTESECGSGAR